MGAHAVRAALADAGIAWADVQFAYGGSEDGGNADTMVTELGPTGLPFTNVKNGCATGGSALVAAVRALQSGAYEIGVVVGFDKHPRGAFENDPADWSLPAWYGEHGLMVTTQFFGAKLQRYMHEHGIPRETLVEVAVKAFANGSLTPHAWRRAPLSAEEILASPMLAHPLTQYMLCSPGEGAAALVVATAKAAARLDARPVWLRSVAFRTRLAGSFEVFSPSLELEIAPSPTVDAAREAFEVAGVEPSDVDVVQVQDTESGRGADPSGRVRFLRARRAGRPVRDGRDADRRPAAGQHRRRLSGERRAGGRLRPAPGLRGRDAAARRGGRAPGARRSQGRLHPGVRRSGRERVHGPEPLTRRSVSSFVSSC